MISYITHAEDRTKNAPRHVIECGCIIVDKRSGSGQESRQFLFFYKEDSIKNQQKFYTHKKKYTQT